MFVDAPHGLQRQLFGNDIIAHPELWTQCMRDDCILDWGPILQAEIDRAFTRETPDEVYA